VQIALRKKGTEMRQRRAAEAVPFTEASTTFNARLSKRMKNDLQRAADLRGQSLSEFVLGSAYDRAVATISAESTIRLSERDSEAFAHALLTPPAVDAAVLARFLKADRTSRA
jgi:uncharacterized protein (DUF1778 family)